ncbi:hypothetical protein AB0C59_27545 [Streptomyces sp. NPDC048664]|uniref:hypothetical protein n=1 Tax=Streptomyces sp. NPDC048664 TaxID=3154505 RepID=UPI00341CFAFE
MTVQTVREQGPAIRALSRLLSEHPDLISHDFEVGRIITSRGAALGIAVSLHEAMGHTRADLDAWRAALAIPAHEVISRRAVTPGLEVIDAYGSYAGVTVLIRLFDAAHAKAV